MNSNYLTTGLLLLLIAELVGMIGFSYYKLQRQLQPERLAEKAEQVVVRNYPEIRQQVKQNIAKNSPEIAEKISRELISSAPNLREVLERITARQLEYGLDEATEFSAEQFREFLQENRQEVKLAIEQLEEAPEEANETMKQLENQMEKQFGTDLASQADNALIVHRKFNSKLERLTGPAPLEPKELLERRILRILKTMQKKKLPDVTELEDELVTKSQ